ncbi:Flagellar M-ring protein [Azospirillaceae bacterium]
MNAFLQMLRSLGPTKLAALGAVGFVFIGFFIYLSTRISTPGMELLYAELQPADAAAIAKKLDEQKVPYKVDSSGAKVMVPADQVGKMRMIMAQAGLPNGGSIGYEIFDRPEGFGATSFVQQMNQLRALEGEMARTIASLNGVQQARVHLVLPKREMFSRTQNTASASVFVKMRIGNQLSHEQISAIQHLIASSVSQLQPSQISIIDDKGKLLARGVGADSEEGLIASAEEKKRNYERRLTQTIEDLVGRSVGYGKVRAEVSADLDFDRITTNSEIYDPETQVVRSTQTVDEKSETQDRDPLEPVTVNNNIPGSNAPSSAETRSAGPISSTRNNRTEETVNYEISKTTKAHVRESGQVRRMSVAVLVDGVYDPPNGGPTAYKPRPAEELAQIEKLVRSAVGIDSVRGDVLDVVNMRFAIPEHEFAESEKIFGLPKEDVMRIAEMLVLAIVAILVILLVVRPLINRALEKPEESDSNLLMDQSIAAAALAPPGGALAEDLALEAAAADEELEQMIDINRVEGRVRASSLRKVGEIVDKHPEEAVSIIRNWLYQET